MQFFKHKYDANDMVNYLSNLKNIWNTLNLVSNNPDKLPEIRLICKILVIYIYTIYLKNILPFNQADS